MSEKTTVGQSSNVQKAISTATSPSVHSNATTSTPQPTQPLSTEDKMILYAVLQDVANELRRITHERKQTIHQSER